MLLSKEAKKKNRMGSSQFDFTPRLTRKEVEFLNKQCSLLLLHILFEAKIQLLK